MRTFVWVDSWQQECCGQHFEVGARVNWSVYPTEGRDLGVAELLDADWGDRVRFREDHHGPDAAPGTVTGTVVGIQVVSTDVVQDGPRGYWVPVEGSGRLESVPDADPIDARRRSDEVHDRSHNGWIVELDGVVVDGG